MNNLISEFDTTLLSLSNDISKFWNMLLKDRNTNELYKNGIKIAQKLNLIQEIEA